MFKLALALPLFFAAVNAGLLGAPLAYSSPLLAAPVAHVATPIVKAALPVATSYQNTVQISSGAVPVVAAAPIVKAAPLLAAPALAAPVLKTPLIAAHSPFLSLGAHY